MRNRKIDISVEDVDRCLSALNTNKGPGPDGIPPLFYKKTQSIIAWPLQLLFSKSLNQGIFPSKWKHTFIIPIFKSGATSKVDNYRPITILSAVSKIFESCLITKLTPIFNSLIIPEQHGFYKQRSTVTNLFSYVNLILTALGRGSEVHSIYMDFSKAFDKVNHSILIHKLEEYGVSGSLLTWFISYISNRSQQVKIANCLSHMVNVTSGVPQGSILGPLLFLIYVNDIGYKFESPYRLFADDLKIFRIINSRNDVTTLQRDLGHLEEWCVSNNMLLNEDKCHAINFSRKIVSCKVKYILNGQILNFVSEVRDLGITLDSKLTFIPHYEKIVCRANKILGCVTRYGSEFKNLQTIKTLYVTLVRSVTEYGCILWSPQYKIHIDRLEAIQRKFLNCVKHKLPNNLQIDFNYNLSLSYLGMTTLCTRRKYFQLCFVFRVMNNLLDCNEILHSLFFYVPQFAVRRSPLFSIESCRRNYTLNSPLNTALRTCNEFSDSLDFFNCQSYAVFKNRVHHLLCS